jgi:hypothetical protein
MPVIQLALDDLQRKDKEATEENEHGFESR